MAESTVYDATFFSLNGDRLVRLDRADDFAYGLASALEIPDGGGGGDGPQ